VILTALSFTFIVSMPMASVSVLFKEISGDLKLDVVQIGSVWGIISLGSIFITPVGGIICDRLGAARTIMIIGLLGGITGALRGFANSFFTLMTTTFLWGLVSAAVAPALTMSVSLASAEEKQGLGQGFLGVGGGLGLILGSMISATVISPHVGGWRNVFILYGGLSVLIGLVWMFRVRSEPKVRTEGPRPAASFFRVFSRVVRVKELWLIGFAIMAYQGCVVGTQGYLPYFLQGVGWSTVAAGGALAAYSAAGTAGVIPLTMLSDRLGSRKVCLYASFLLTILGVGLVSVVHNWALWILLIAAGMFSQMNSALFVVLCIETVAADASYSATIVSLVLSMGLVGRAISSPLGNSLAGIGGNIAWPFIFWAGLGIAGLVILSFINEHPEPPRSEMAGKAGSGNQRR
jgi:CP family cyanate transporter-like MFS transporter